MALISLALCAYMTHRSPSAAFYLLPSRAWELLFGAIVFLSENRLRGMIRTRYSVLLGAVGLALILWPAFILTPQAAVPWPWAVPTVIGTMLLLGVVSRRDPVGELLGSPLVVPFGLISYSAYLWHQPILAFSRMIFPYTLNTASLLLLLGVSWGIAALSYRFIEQPFRRRHFWHRLPLFGGTALLLAFIGGIGVIGWKTHGLPGRFDQRQLALAGMGAAAAERSLICMASDAELLPRRKPCVGGLSGQRRVAIMGDSHAAALADGIVPIAKAGGWRFISYARAGCAPVLDSSVLVPEMIRCGPYNRATLRRILADPEIDTVVLAGRWRFGIEHMYFDNGEGGIESSPKVQPADAKTERRMETAWRDTVDRIGRAGKRVLLVYPVPEMGWDVPGMLLKQSMLGVHWSDASVSQAIFRKRNERAYRLLDRLGNDQFVSRIYPERALCNTFVPERCAAQVEGKMFYFDDDHLAPLGARLVFARSAHVFSLGLPH